MKIKKIFLLCTLLVQWVLISNYHLAVADPNAISLVSPVDIITSVSAPCGGDLLYPCSKVVENMIDGAKNHFDKHIKFVYNYGELNGKPMVFDDGFGRMMNFSTAQGEQIWPACDICGDGFSPSHEIREINSDGRGRSCGTDIRINVSRSGAKIATWGTKVPAWYVGLSNYSIWVTMNNDFNLLRTPSEYPQIAVSPGCQTAARKYNSLISRPNGAVALLEKQLGKDGIKEVKKSFATWESSVKANPDQGNLRQLAQELDAFRKILEAEATYLMICSIADQAGINFRNKIGNWNQFMSPQVIESINQKVSAKVRSACAQACKLKGLSKHIGRCLACLNQYANIYAPPEVQSYIQASCNRI